MKAQVLSREEAKALLAACPDTNNGLRDRALLTALWRGSMRISATLRIRPADIDWERNLITIHQDKNGDGRTVVLDQQAMDVLRAWRERRSSLGINGHHPFFCATYGTARGSELDPSHYRRLIKRLARKAGVEKIAKADERRKAESAARQMAIDEERKKRLTEIEGRRTGAKATVEEDRQRAEEALGKARKIGGAEGERLKAEAQADLDRLTALAKDTLKTKTEESIRKMF